MNCSDLCLGSKTWSGQGTQGKANVQTKIGIFALISSSSSSALIIKWGPYVYNLYLPVVYALQSRQEAIVWWDVACACHRNAGLALKALYWIWIPTVIIWAIPELLWNQQASIYKEDISDHDQEFSQDNQNRKYVHKVSHPDSSKHVDKEGIQDHQDEEEDSHLEKIQTQLFEWLDRRRASIVARQVSAKMVLDR